MGRHARTEPSHDEATARASAATPTPVSEGSNAYVASAGTGYIGRRARMESGEALSVAALRERLALESYHRLDPVGAPVVARALAVVRDSSFHVDDAVAPISPAILTAPSDDTATDFTVSDAAAEVIGVTAHGSRHAVSRGRRSTPSDAPAVFRVPAGSPLPGSRVATARRRATAAARRRPLLLSTPVLVAALIAGGSIGAEQLSASGASTSGAAAASSSGSVSLSHSDVRVSRSKRDASSINLGGAGTPAETQGPAIPDAAALPGAAPLPAPVVETATPVPAPPPVAAPAWFRPVEGGYMNSCFCMRWGSFHDGIDIDPPLGTPIVAVGDGTVVFAGPVSGYGIGIDIQHADGTVSFYGHMAIYYVRTGDVVTAGEEIALVGNEGFSTGPHLHFSVFSSWDNGARTNAIDPVPWLAERGIDMGPYNPNG